MEYRICVSKLFIIVGSLGLFVGCSPGFQAASQNLANSSSSLSDAQQVETPVQPKSDLGSLTWSEKNHNALSDDQDLDLSFELKVPYGRVYKLASKAVRFLSPYACQWNSSLLASSPGSYENGEIPCGSIINNNWKLLLQVPIAAYSDDVSGFDVRVSGTTLPILLSRSTKQGSYQEANLDTKKIETKTSSRQFAEDISFRYTPQGSKARLEMCLNVPGGTVTSNDQTLRARAEKKILGIKTSYSSNFSVDVGAATFDYARGCFAMDVGALENGLGLALTATQKPYLSNVRYSGLDIRIEDWFLRMADKLMSFFKVSLRKNAIQRLNGKIENLADSEIETGAWFTRVHGEALLKNTGDKISARVSRILTRTGLPAHGGDIKTILADKCRLIKFSSAKEWTQRLATFCTEKIDQLQIEIDPFSVDEASQQAGCYNYFANIHNADAKNKSWWNTQCYFKSKFSIRLPVSLKEFSAELKALLSLHVSEVQLPDEWTQAIEQYDIDPYTLALLLQNLDNNGYSQIVPNDWVQNIPRLLDQLRQAN